MARQSTSRWRQRSDAIIAEGLLRLPADMPAKEKRKRLNDLYPFGERAMLPYKHWLKALNAVVPREKKPMGRFVFTPAEGLPASFPPFLEAMLASLADDAPRLIFADFLAEQGDGREMEVRNVVPGIMDAAKRAYRHMAFTDAVKGGFVRDAIEGKTLLTDPDLVTAIRVEKTLAALRLFGKVVEK